MSVKVSCPHCEHTWTIATLSAGKSIRCKMCQKTFVVGKGGRRRGDEDDEDYDVDRPQGRRGKRGGAPAWVWVLAAGVLVAGVTALVVGLAMKGGKKGKNEPGTPSASSRQKVQPGMTEEQVVALLGPPKKSGTYEQVFGKPSHVVGFTQNEKVLMWDTADGTQLYVFLGNGKVQSVSGTGKPPPDDRGPVSPLAKAYREICVSSTQPRTEARAISLFGQPTRTVESDPYFPQLNGVGVGIGTSKRKILLWEDGTNKISVHLIKDYIVATGSVITSADPVPPLVNPALTVENFRKLKPQMPGQEVRRLFGRPVRVTRTDILGGGGPEIITWEGGAALTVHISLNRLVSAEFHSGNDKLTLGIPLPLQP